MIVKKKDDVGFHHEELLQLLLTLRSNSTRIEEEELFIFRNPKFRN